jgi:hypothetical protein
MTGRERWILDHRSQHGGHPQGIGSTVQMSRREDRRHSAVSLGSLLGQSGRRWQTLSLRLPDETIHF